MLVVLGNTVSRVVGISDEISQYLSHACSFKVKGAEFTDLCREGKWDGRKRLYSRKTNTFATGLWPRVRLLLNEHCGPGHMVVDQRKPNCPYLDMSICIGIDQRAYQHNVVDVAIREGRAVLQVATGGGKTVIAAQIMSKLKQNSLFLVHTKDLLYQAKDSFAELFNMPIGQIGDGVIDLQPVTVATIQSMSRVIGVDYEHYDYEDIKYVDKTDVTNKRTEIVRWLGTVDILFWDEVHRIACETAYNVNLAISNPYYRFGLSASPWRDDGADKMIEAAIGHKACVVTASSLVEQGYLVPPFIQRVHVAPKYAPRFDKRTYAQVYKDEIVNNDERNKIIIHYAIEFMNRNIPTMILIQHIKHGQILKRMIDDCYHPIEFINGGDFTLTRKRAIQQIREGNSVGIIASSIADEGLDIKNLGALILAGGGKSSTKALQRIGRVLRPYKNKERAYVVDFVDGAKWLKDHANERLRIYHTESTFQIIDIGGQ